MAYKDDQEAVYARVAVLERQAGRAQALEQRVRELEQENQRLNVKLRELQSAQVSPAPAADPGDAGEVDQIYLDDRLIDYIETLVEATRSPGDHGLTALAEQILSGALPEDASSLARAARACAMANQRKYVLPVDIHQVLSEVIGHRILLKGTAEAAGLTSEDVIQALLEQIEVP